MQTAVLPLCAPTLPAAPAVPLPRISTAAELEVDARRCGFLPGWPADLPDQVRRIDFNTTRRMRCPACHARGMECRPFHQPGRYRIVAACLACNAGEIV